MKVPITISFELQTIQAVKTKCYSEKIPISEYVSKLVEKDLAEIEAAKNKNPKTNKKGK